MSEIEHEVIAVTGAAGNLGTKLIAALLESQPSLRVLGLDLIAGKPNDRVEWVECNLADAGDSRWKYAIDRSTGLVHFAAKNPYPEADWDDATVSVDMTLHVMLAAAHSPTMRRVVFATSNHVMGRYKEDGANDAARKMKATDTVGVGTVWYANGVLMDSTIYAVPKFCGERLCKALAAQCARRGGPSFVCVRIGWCQPGDNSALTLNASGTPTLAASDTDAAENDGAADSLRDAALLNQWYRSMWLSNRDFTHIFARALVAPLPAERAGFLLAHGMSENSGMRWDLTESKQILGYEPKDDVQAELRRAAAR